MEIRTTLNRFLSIFLIVAMGVAFFSGIRASEPDMRLSGDAYFDEHELMDLKVISTLGLTDADVEALEAIEGVEKAEPAYMTDVLCEIDDNEKVVHVESMAETLNKIDIQDGRMPEAADECVVDAQWLLTQDFQIGDTIALKSGTDDDLSDTLDYDTFTIVGTCSSPLYISFDRGSTNVGKGEIDVFIYVPEESFCQEVYSQIWLTVAGAKDETAFTDTYTSLVDEVKARVEDIQDERCEVRYQEIMDDANSEIEEAESELESAKEEADEQLESAREELESGEAELESGEAELDEQNSLLESTKGTLYSTRTELDNGWSQYYDGVTQLESQKAEFEEQEAAFEEQEAVLEALTPQYEEAKAGYDTGLEAYETSKAQYDAAQAAYDAQTSGLEIMRLQLQALEEKINAGTATSEEIALAGQLREAIAQMEDQKEGLDQWKSQLETAKTQLDQAAALISGYEEGKAALEAARPQLESGRQQLEAAQTTLDATRSQLEAGETALTDGWAQVNDGESQIAEGYQTIEENRQTLQDGWDEYEDAVTEAESKIADGELKLQDARSEIAGIERPDWYVTDRDDYSDYTGYGDNADRMRAIGEVFPVLFFLVAALISLTTMTRMVEEERTQIGTLKALGYSRWSIMAKYVGYAFLATLAGCIFGVLVGQKIFPYIIVTAYKIMYPYIPDVVIPYQMSYSLIASVAALICTLAATLFSSYRALIAEPAELMRPEAPKSGRRVLMERIPFIWKHLNFTWKSTIRNLMRYKKRFFMTIFGIGGCMALMVVGYGLKDSIMDIARIQYGKLQLYDAMAILDDQADESELEDIYSQLDKDDSVYGYSKAFMQSVTLGYDDAEWDAYLYVPESLEGLSDFFIFDHRVGGETFELDDDGAILTEKAARELGVSAGDSITVENADGEQITVKIADICENYMEHYLYISPNLYEELTGKAMTVNTVVVRMNSEDAEQIEALGEMMLGYDSVLTLTYTENLLSQVTDMLEALDSVIVVLIMSAGLLAFIVLYNLNNININERQRELATLKVLGFYDKEISAYVYRENVLLTFIGVAVGCLLGKLLHSFVIQTVEIDMCMFGRNIEPSSYLYSILFTFAFSVLVNLAMHFKLKKINMVESLKSVE